MGITAYKMRVSHYLPAHASLAALAASWACAVVISGCALEEVTLVEAEDVVVAEVYVQVGGGEQGTSRATAWLHHTLAAGSPTSGPVPGALVLITDQRGFALELAETSQDTCVFDTPIEGTGTCYSTPSDLAGRILPGDRLEVEVVLPGGRLITGSSRVPESFSLVVPAGVTRCEGKPLTPLEVRWTASPGAWAYVSETLIGGLREALAPRGIVVEKSPLHLLGLSVSATDTSIVFPGEFGVFDRYDLDQALAIALQEGLPAGTDADVVVTAVDRNYVNWIRGGNFNPSGVVRVPSLRGDGTGVFASSVSRGFRVVVAESGTTLLPPCTAG